jgi:hypothetical protein
MVSRHLLDSHCDHSRLVLLCHRGTCKDTDDCCAMTADSHQTQLNITKPISDTWNPLAKYQIDFNAFALAIAAISIVLDVIILCLPLFIIHTLHMRTKQKVLTGGILWLGVL